MLAHYTIQFVDEISYELETEEGITYGASYEDVVHRLVSYFGEKNVCSFEVEAMEEVLTRNDVQEFMKTFNT